MSQFMQKASTVKVKDRPVFPDKKNKSIEHQERKADTNPYSPYSEANQKTGGADL